MGSITWYHVFAAELVEDYNLSANEFPPSRTTFPQTTIPQSVAFQYTLDGTVTRRANFGTDTALRVSMCGEADFQYWITTQRRTIALEYTSCCFIGLTS